MREPAITPRELVKRAAQHAAAKPALSRSSYTPTISIKIAGKGGELPRLVDARTGEPLGICASAAVAQRTKDFFA